MKLKPDLADAHYNLGTTYQKQNRLDEAAKEFMTALKLNPDDAEAHRDLEICYARMKSMKR